MDSLKKFIQWLQFMMIIFLSISLNGSIAGRIDTLVLNPTGTAVLKQLDLSSPTTISDDIETYFYSQTLDHFNYKPESYTTFQQRYLIKYKYWGGAAVNAPIFVYLGGEQALETGLASVGFLEDNAPHSNALIVYIEHRYYGQSIPFGSREEAFKSAYSLGYFNSAQALADYAEIIMYIKNQLQASYCPVIVIGASYGGMLASWFRLKYPHVALGALASSAPVLYFDNITPTDGFHSIIAKSFRETSESCYQTILKSWSLIDSYASQPWGLSVLSSKFRTCYPLSSGLELKRELESIYETAAQFNLPSYLVRHVCGAIDGTRTNDILYKIFAGVVVLKGSDAPCYINPPTVVSETVTGWKWQACSEMVIPIGPGKNGMFQPDPFDLNEFTNECIRTYGVAPRPHWITSYYGGNDFKFYLQKFGSNIIFSNGLLDPFSAGGVLEDISESILAVSTTYGSHILDLISRTDNDPEWLIRQRDTEMQIIERWIYKYYDDLTALKG